VDRGDHGGMEFGGKMGACSKDEVLCGFAAAHRFVLHISTVFVVLRTIVRQTSTLQERLEASTCGDCHR